VTYALGMPCIDVLDQACEALTPHLADNEAFSTQTLPGRDEPFWVADQPRADTALAA
jgi:hypothetical protein